MSSCPLLQDIKKKIDSGIPPEEAIPYHIPVLSMLDYAEVLNYAVQVLPDGNRKNFCKQKLEEIIEDVRWTESE